MAEYDDNQELMQVRRWWASNGTAAVIGIALGVVVIGGWYGWHWYQNRQDYQAANIFAQVQQGISHSNVTDGVVNATQRLEDHYSGTPYAGAAAMALGAWYMGNKNYDKAVSQLDWAAGHVSDPGMQNLARVRQARAVWAKGDAPRALKILASDHPPAFDSLYSELSGDIHAAQGQRGAAYAAYKNALARLPANMSREPLQQKMAANAPTDGSTGSPAADTDANPSDNKASPTS